MAKFADTKGREWAVVITVGNLDDLAQAGLDVESVAEDPAKLVGVVNKARTFAAVLWALVGEQVTAQGVSPQDFKAALDGPTLFAAAGALEEAVMSFSLPPTLATTFREKWAGAMDRALAKANQTLARALDGLGGSDSSAGSGPASPGSTPGP